MKQQDQNIKYLHRGINDFKKGFQPRTNVVKHEKGDLFADSYSIVARWRDYFSQLLNVHGVNDTKHRGIHTIGSLVPLPSAFEFELAIEMLKRQKSAGINQIPAELFRYVIHKLLISIWNREELPEE